MKASAASTVAKGCADQLFSLCSSMERSCEYHHPLYICFIDLKKAYDSVNRDSLWRILQHSYQLPEKLLSIIRALHDGSYTVVRASERFPVTGGV
jgi:hypothetical protein